METEELPLKGLLKLSPTVISDHRGYFYEQVTARSLGMESLEVAQINVSSSIPGVIRGLHYQVEQPQAKLISVLRGRIWDVAVDLRRQSPTFGKIWFGWLDDMKGEALYLPEGFAHGFRAGPSGALISYTCSRSYVAELERIIRWNDEQLAIPWQVEPGVMPIMSNKDRAGASFRDAEVFETL